jgi:Domain of unknown function (DUF1917)
MTAKGTPPGGNEVRSNFVSEIQAGELSSTTHPCDAPDGHYWVHAFAPASSEEVDRLLIGKWLIRMTCPYVEEYWCGMIRPAVEAGTLGISAKIATEWGRNNDPAGPWRNHVVCVYTSDWRDEADVLRVAARLHEIGAVKKMQLTYKPDLFTYGGVYEGKSPGDVAIYTCKTPYDQLTIDHRNRAAAEAMLRGLAPRP